MRRTVRRSLREVSPNDDSLFRLTHSTRTEIVECANVVPLLQRIAEELTSTEGNQSFTLERVR